MPTLQETMDAFIRKTAGDQPAALLHAEQCMEALTSYLLHFSDLFGDREMQDESEYAEWEEHLEAQMNDLLQGDIEMVGDLGALPLQALDPEHLRDFLGWYLLRETGDAELIQVSADTLQAWVEFTYACDWWRQSEYLGFKDMLSDVTPAAVRVARLSQVLFHYVRSGVGVPPRLRGQRFSRFVEGHGRVAEIADGGLYLNFENQIEQIGSDKTDSDKTDSDKTGSEKIGPVLLPRPVLSLTELGDVFDIELGLRGDSWVMVDIGPVYPRCVYVEVEEYTGLEKIS